MHLLLLWFKGHSIILRVKASKCTYRRQRPIRQSIQIAFHQHGVEVQPLEEIELNENSKLHVAVLCPGEALESGIGRKDVFDHSLNLTGRDVRRLEKTAIALTNLGPDQDVGAVDSRVISFSTSLTAAIGNLDQAYSMFNSSDL
jgi:hypothetical protein